MDIVEVVKIRFFYQLGSTVAKNTILMESKSLSALTFTLLDSKSTNILLVRIIERGPAKKYYLHTTGQTPETLT